MLGLSILKSKVVIIDNIELYKEWFGEDNIENIKDKIIESAIVNWFEDEDAGIEKVWNYFRAI